MNSLIGKTSIYVSRLSTNVVPTNRSSYVLQNFRRFIILNGVTDSHCSIQAILASMRHLRYRHNLIHFHMRHARHCPRDGLRLGTVAFLREAEIRLFRAHGGSIPPKYRPRDRPSPGYVPRPSLRARAGGRADRRTEGPRPASTFALLRSAFGGPFDGRATQPSAASVVFVLKQKVE